MVAQTIPHLARAAAQNWPGRESIIDGDRRISFSELNVEMMRAAAAFVSAGLSVGDRVCIWGENSTNWIIACLGLQAAGGVLVPLNTRFRRAEADYIINRSHARFAVASKHFLDTPYFDILLELEAPNLDQVIGLDDASWNAFLGSSDSASQNEAERRLNALTPDNVSDIMFTSGTTGDPKGAIATHGQTVETARLWAKATTIGAGDKFLILWPFFHCSGYKAGWVVNLAVGATTIPEPVLNVAGLMEKVAREQVTFLPGPPTLFQTLLADETLDKNKLSSVRVSITGASAVAPSMIEAMRNELGIPIVLTGYGLTESCGTVTMTSPEDPPEIVTTSCGRAIDGIELALFDQDNQPVPIGEPGEVVVRGMNVMLGYLDDPDATAKTIDQDGWLHTGDIGILDEAGYLRITDRKKDIFIVGGFNCYPAEIEKMLLSHPAILQVAVAGVPDERLGEVGKAWVVLKPGSSLDIDTLTAWARERMANFKVPRAIEFLPELPTNATGKVQKFKLLEQAEH